MPHDATIRWDCRHYAGDRPCRFGRLCAGCGEYAPYAARVCVIKLAALGDVIRSTCLLPAIRRAYPDAQITWVTKPNGRRMLEGHPLIDRLIEFDALSCMALLAERFDLVLSLDKEPEPCALAMGLTAADKRGIGLSRVGTPAPLNAEAVDYFLLGLSDELKFKVNRKSYPLLIHEAVGLEDFGERYTLPLDASAASSVRSRLAEAGWRADRATLGVNVGAGKVFANKMWPAERIVRLLESVHARDEALQVVLLGGEEERSIMRHIHEALPWTIDGGYQNTERQFVALVDACDAVFTGDTMAMHVAIARGRGVVAFFGPTCEQEIDLYGLGEKLTANVACGPCYKRVCDRADVCLSAVSVEAAGEAIGRVLRTAVGQPLRRAA